MLGVEGMVCVCVSVRPGETSEESIFVIVDLFLYGVHLWQAALRYYRLYFWY